MTSFDWKTISVLVLSLILGSCSTANRTSASQPQTDAQAVAEAPVTVAGGTGPILVIAEVPFAKETVVSDAVRNECDLPSKLGQFVQQFAAGGYSQIITDGSQSPGNAQVLKMEISDLVGTGGGAWSGSKMVTIKGTLEENGAVKGNFRARRTSGGGVFAGYKGTCSILGRCVKTLGRDVAEWLQHPSKDSVLGES